MIIIIVYVQHVFLRAYTAKTDPIQFTLMLSCNGCPDPAELAESNRAFNYKLMLCVSTAHVTIVCNTPTTFSITGGVQFVGFARNLNAAGMFDRSAMSFVLAAPMGFLAFPRAVLSHLAAGAHQRAFGTAHCAKRSVLGWPAGGHSSE